MILRVISFLCKEDALWKLGSVCKRFLRLSLLSVKIIGISSQNQDKFRLLTQRIEIRTAIKHAIVTKHTASIGRQKLLYELNNESKDGESNILDFHGEPNDEIILLMAGAFKNLESLYLIDCDKISDQAICTLAKNCNQLKTLNLCNCRQLSDISFKCIALNCTKIVRLDLGNCANITDESVAAMGDTCSDLESLDLFGCRKLTCASLVGLSKSCHQLKKLSISHCFRIKDDGITHLVNNCKLLNNLDLTNCVQITDKAIFSVAENCQNLKILILTKCDKLTIEPMESLISNCTDLQYMDIKGCLRVSDDRIKRLWVKYNKRLQSINTGRTCLEEMEKIREVMLDGTLSKSDFDKWRLEYYSSVRLPITKNVG